MENLYDLVWNTYATPQSVVVNADCLAALKSTPARFVQTCVTSPPYFGLRDYGVSGQLGVEPTPDEYIAAMVEVFREVRRVLTDDGTLWLNIGDSYGSGKHLLGVPWRLAFALQADGWVLRQDIIWHKPNPMPESVRDRCTKAHEYIFLMSKSERYYFDSEAMKEPAIHAGKVVKNNSGKNGQMGEYGATRTGFLKDEGVLVADTRNRRSVWTVATRPYKGAHFATFPPDLIVPCVLAGSRLGDIVLDPFNGSGTTGQVALTHGRKYLGCELNPEYVELTKNRFETLANAKTTDASQ